MRGLNIFLNTPSRRARFALWFGFSFNLLYALWGLGTGIFYRSAWFGAMAVYYILLCTLKFFIIKTDLRVKRAKNRQKAEARAIRGYKSCSRLLGLLNLAIVGIVVLVLLRDESAAYSPFVLWIMGGYTAVRIVISAINIFKLRFIDDPLLISSRCLGISVTVTSLFSFQTALLERFCKNTVLRQVLNGSVGILVSILIIYLAVYTIQKLKEK